MKRYPLKLESVNKDILWGGTLLSEQYGKPAGKIAEAWELTVHPRGINRILNGDYQGMLLSDYLGSDADFPILFKLIDACDRLSVQVHPVKTEMWYIVDCEEGATLVYGLQDTFDEAAFRAALAAETVESLLRTVPVHKGDVFFIPQGLVHAIGAGILIAEIQENANETYRVYDYGRLQNGKPRELHVDAAMETVRDFTDDEIEALRYACGRGEETTLANCSLFKVDCYEADGTLTQSVEDHFLSVVCLDGSATVNGEPMEKGDSFFLPAGLGEVTITGQFRIIVTEKP